ncbi:MAG: ABC transporter permease [Nannocystaceae bacterium]
MVSSSPPGPGHTVGRRLPDRPTQCAIAGLTTAVAVATAAGLGWIGADHARLFTASHEAPSVAHWLGTDTLGRDVASRAMRGAQLSIFTGVAAALGSVAIGTSLGVIAGLRGGWVDRSLITLSQTIGAIPPLILMLGLGVMLHASIASAAFAIAVSQWVGVFRTTRAEAQRLAQSDFIRAAQAMGASPFDILRTHVGPTLAPLWTTTLALHFVYAVKAEAVLGYLGLGSTALPSWGRMLGEGAGGLGNGIWWPVLAAATPLAALVLCAQHIADRKASIGTTPQRRAPARQS